MKGPKVHVTKPLAAVYTRISHEDQSQFSLSSQRAACEGLAMAKGFQTSPALTFVDAGGLATELDRPGLAALREAVNSGVVQAVVVHSVDRLSRKLVHQLILLEEFQKRNAEVLFIDAPDNNSPEGRMLVTLKGLFAEAERERIRERTARGSRQRAKEGKINNRPPFGYMATQDGFLVPHPERAEVVRTIFQRIVEGKTSGEVADSLNRDGVPAPTGSKWIRGTVLQIARRRDYLGQLIWGKTMAAEPARRRKPPRAGRDKRTSSKPRAEKDWIRINIPPILETAMFERAQDAIAINRKRKSGRPSRTYLLTGVIRCGRCRAAICGSYTHGVPYYKCSHVDPVTGKRACGERSIRLDLIEPQVWRDVVDTLSSRARLAALLNAQFVEATAKETDHAAERAEITNLIQKLKRREFRCRQAMLDADLADSFAAFREDLRATVQQRLEAERRLESVAPVQRPARPDDFSEFCRQMDRARKITDRGQQRDFLRACVEQITLTGDEINLRFSLNLPAAMAAIEKAPDQDPGGGNSGRNCQLSQRH